MGQHKVSAVTGPADRYDRRHDILAAAEGLIRDRGFAFSMADLAAHAGMAKGTIYMSFPTRDALLQAVWQRSLKTLICDVAMLVSAGQALADAVSRRTVEDRVFRRLCLAPRAVQPIDLRPLDDVIASHAIPSDDTAFGAGMILDVIRGTLLGAPANFSDDALLQRLVARLSLLTPTPTEKGPPIVDGPFLFAMTGDQRSSISM